MFEEIRNLIIEMNENKRREIYFENHYSVYLNIIRTWGKNRWPNFTQLLYHFHHQLEQLPSCRCGKSVKFKGFNRGYNKYCSSLCASTDTSNFEKKLQKARDTCLRKYGVDNPSKLQETKEKIKKTSLSKYGVDNFTKTNEYLEKVKKTNISKWGKEWFMETSDFKEKTIKMRESVNTLDAVVVTAGTMETGEKARVSVLKPLDIVTTAGSAGNIISALQTLPGTQSVGEDGRLFVRGGEADETQTFVDGIRVAQPYGATTANVPTRGRFSPFLFSGMSFSTGGYSAEYGEALSSVLLLNTQDEASEEKTDISLMTVGLGLANTQKWGNNSLSFNTAYINLEPYQKVFPQRADWNKPFQSLSGEAVYRHSFTSGMFKLYAAFEASQFDINSETINIS